MPAYPHCAGRSVTAKIQGFSLYDLADRLRARGWQVPAYSLPADCQNLVIQRILVRHGVSRDLGSLLLDDIKRTDRILPPTPSPCGVDGRGSIRIPPLSKLPISNLRSPASRAADGTQNRYCRRFLVGRCAR